MRKSVLLLSVCFTLYAFQAAPQPKLEIGPGVQAVLDHIRANSMRGDLSFLASDLLEGRDSPSRGLDIAAEYIAAQFRRAGLESGGDENYFQTAKMVLLEPNTDGLELKITQGGNTVTAGAAELVSGSPVAFDLQNAPVFKLDLSDSAMVEGLAADQLNGKVVITGAAGGARNSNMRSAMRKMRDAKPALVITVDKTGAGARTRLGGQLADPTEKVTAAPRITWKGEAAAAFFAELKPGPSDAVASVHLPAPLAKPVTLHNVIGILRGSDPTLKDTCVIVSAHYDHLGERTTGTGDRIFNGANDDGSGTVSVIELARALSSLPQRPRRSILFMTFFGEEKGLLGSRYYAHHPIWPLNKTIAQVNLEQLGRTDDTEGPDVAAANVTGFDFSNLTDVLVRAGQATGIRFWKHPRNSELFFGASDNQSLANAGIPAHTISVSYEFPDYHAVGDEWQKIDYENMAKVDRAVALALITIANSTEAPHWNEESKGAAAYIKAWKELHP